MSKMILVDEKTVKQALEALESLRHSWADARFISISALREALEQPPVSSHPAASDDNQLEDALNSLAFYRRRYEMLQQWQSKMRDPERTIVCDILANGQTLPPGVAGDRYKQPPADEPVAWTDAEAIANLPAVDEAIRILLDDQTGDNATALVQAILDTRPQPAAQGEEVTMDEILGLADLHAEDSLDSGNRVFDRGGLLQFAKDILRHHSAPEHPAGPSADFSSPKGPSI